ncbi:MAG: metallophosphoesterase, partial [Raoultibacter sp.]
MDAPFAVAVLHTGLHLDYTKAPCNPSDLLARGMDYWALGHIHVRYVDNPANPHLAFSGCI